MDKQERIELTKEILKAVAILSFISATAVIAPAAVGAVGKLFFEFSRYQKSKQWQYRSRAKRAIRRLENQGLVVTQTRGEEMIIKITQAGKRWVRRREIENLIIQKPKRWDGLWRLVIFDIPEETREIRNVVRGWLKRLGFARLQQSAWVIP